MRYANDLIVEELRNDQDLRRIHLSDALTCFVKGDIGTGALMLRNLVNATCGFVRLGAALNKNPKSLMRMLSASGKPGAENLFGIIHFLMEKEGLGIDVTRVKQGRKRVA